MPGSTDRRNSAIPEGSDTTIPADAGTPRKDTGHGQRNNESIEEEPVSNRPIEDEQRDRQDLPQRGERKEGAHA